MSSLSSSRQNSFEKLATHSSFNPPASRAFINENQCKIYVKNTSDQNKLASKTQTKKRSYEESFGNREYDIERYGQEIPANYFETHTGHAVIT